MNPAMVYAEVKKQPLATLIYEYERVTEGEVGIRVWKRRATTESIRNWKGRPRYVPIAELSAVEAEERRRKRRLYCSNMSPAVKSKRKKTSKEYDDGRKEEVKKNRKSRARPCDSTGMKQKNRKPLLLANCITCNMVPRKKGSDKCNPCQLAVFFSM
jgi:hypothetical protein